MKLLHTGSVKSLYEVPGGDSLVFHFSDRYSVFDWGAMPDLLEGKGEALASMAWSFFKLCEQAGIDHHCLGPCNELGEVDYGLERFSRIKVRTVNVLRNDLGAYQQRPTQTLVPLEVLFRYGIPEGSSLIERSKDPVVQKSLGLKAPVEIGQRFELPLIEFSTKLEPMDRMLTHQEAQKLSGVTDDEWSDLLEFTHQVAALIKRTFTALDVELWDGKIELAFGDLCPKKGKRNFVLVDSIGPDELRLKYRGQGLSKENLRQYYRKTPWYPALIEAKKMASSGGDWKKICVEELKQCPPALGPELKKEVEDMYGVLADEIGLLLNLKRSLRPELTLEGWYEKRGGP